jgi:hypothetical protein
MENSRDQATTKQADVEDFILSVTVTVIFRVVYLFVVTTCECPVNLLTNPNPLYT